MELDDVGMFELGQVFENELDLVLLGFEVLPLRELDLVPHHFDTLFGVHCQVSTIDPRNIPLLHLKNKIDAIGKKFAIITFRMQKESVVDVSIASGSFCRCNFLLYRRICVGFPKKQYE